MIEEFVPFGGRVYFGFLALLFFSRGMDFFSTWVATPNLVLEANPIARKLGWRFGLLLNLVLCGWIAVWPLPSVVIATTSLMVAARNFQQAWLMRSMGEHNYRFWMSEQLFNAPRKLFFFCLVAQTGLVAFLGTGLMYFSRLHLVPLGVGLGLVTYALAVLVYSTLSVWRILRRPV